MDEKKINDEILNLVSGGVLGPGWQDATLEMMKQFKIAYGDEGKARFLNLFETNPDDDPSLDEKDLLMIRRFIEDNWNRL